MISSSIPLCHLQLSAKYFKNFCNIWKTDLQLLKEVTETWSLSIPNSCGHPVTQGVIVLRSSKSDDHHTDHGHVLRRVLSRLIRISVFPFLGGLTSSLNNKPVSEKVNVRREQDLWTFIFSCSLLLIDKKRVKQKTYI
jgi:hypothetical protein